MTSRGFKLWRDRVLHDEVWEHAKIRQWCKAIHQLNWAGVASGHASSVTPDEAGELVTMFEQRWPGRLDGPRVTEEQAEIGRNWLATKGIRMGLPRDRDYRSITHFTFVGGKVFDGGYRPYTTPVYVGFFPDGTALRYWATPWQDRSDFAFDIIERTAA
jgi:hypothetical protein